jgi:hypothetical protein
MNISVSKCVLPRGTSVIPDNSSEEVVISEFAENPVLAAKQYIMHRIGIAREFNTVATTLRNVPVIPAIRKTDAIPELILSADCLLLMILYPGLLIWPAITEAAIIVPQMDQFMR